MPFPAGTLGEALDFLKAKSKEIFPEGYHYDFQARYPRQYGAGRRRARLCVSCSRSSSSTLVLAAQYDSLLDRLIILIALPTALFDTLLPLNIGGVLGFASVDVYSQIGLVTLIGLISQARHPDRGFRANRLQETRGPVAARRNRGSGRGALETPF